MQTAYRSTQNETDEHEQKNKNQIPSRQQPSFYYFVAACFGPSGPSSCYTCAVSEAKLNVKLYKKFHLKILLQYCSKTNNTVNKTDNKIPPRRPKNPSTYFSYYEELSAASFVPSVHANKQLQFRTQQSKRSNKVITVQK
jgi:hypothetical protein